MSIDRRVSAESRRRRVIYQTGREITTGTAADRRAAEKLREARRPTASYGAHVNRRLRGRWFSLVPVRRRTMSFCGVAIFGSAIFLSLLHWAATTWPPLASNAELARPLRLDHPDSLGTWARTFFLAASAATSLLVYQLRRYKVDDYQGHYRIWRPVIFLFALLSIDSVCQLVPWTGAMIDAVLGKRVALAGADWIRIVLTVGGAVLAIRLLAEVRRSKLAFLMMLVAVASFAIPFLSRWNVLDTTTMPGWIAVTTAPLIASAALWISVGGYLRMLFREVRGLDQELVVVQELATKKPKSADRDEDEKEEPRGWFRRRSSEIDEPVAKPVERVPRTDSKPKLGVAEEGATPTRSWISKVSFGRINVAVKDKNLKAESKVPGAKSQTSIRTDEAEKVSTEPKRRWFSLRRGKTEMAAKPVSQKQVLIEKVVPEKVAAEKAVVKVAAKAANTETAAKPKKSWFSLGRSKAEPLGTDAEPTKKPVEAKPQPPKSTADSGSGLKPALESESAKPERKGLGAWLRRDSTAKPATNDQNPPATRPANSPATAKTDDSDGDEDDIDDGSVDWSTMNKSERRRMRKEIKRGGRAA